MDTGVYGHYWNAEVAEPVHNGCIAYTARNIACLPGHRYQVLRCGP